MPRRQLNWVRKEVVLACDLVVRNGWKELRTRDASVQELSRRLREMDVYPVSEQPENFRSPDAVSRKTSDLMTAHPDYRGAQTGGSRLDREVVQQFVDDPRGMAAEAADIRKDLDQDTPRRRDRRPDVADSLTAAHVDAALREWWALGRDAFLARYGGRRAERYVVVTDLGEADALPLLLGARALAGLDTTGPWRGDRRTVAEPLRDLGFRVDELDARPAPAGAGPDVAGNGPERDGGRGQGFMVDQRAKVVIERYAMRCARDHYEHLGTVTDTSAAASWDYEVVIGGDRWHVEVKGTIGDPVDVLLTPGEVAHARKYEWTALYVVGNISVQVAPDGQYRASGGTVRYLHPWVIDDGDLRPTGYTYRLPGPSVP